MAKKARRPPCVNEAGVAAESAAALRALIHSGPLIALFNNGDLLHLPVLGWLQAAIAGIDADLDVYRDASGKSLRHLLSK